jgi:hypothetical protein
MIGGTIAVYVLFSILALLIIISGIKYGLSDGDEGYGYLCVVLVLSGFTFALMLTMIIINQDPGTTCK